MQSDIAASQIFPHVRIVMGMVVGLGMTRLLSGVARVIQHPDRHPPSAIHLGWVLFVLLMLVHFWWWEIRLFEISHWTFVIYLFLIGYAVLLFLLCAFLFPESMVDYRDYEDFFFRRRSWFFAALAATYLIDLADTLLKGRAHLEALGAEYLARIPIGVGVCILAMVVRNKTAHAVLVIGMLAYEAVFIFRLFDTL